jgi:arsenate reductase
MADIVILHNPNCSTSRHAVDVAAELGVDVTERRYLLKAERLSRDEIVELAGILEDPVTDLVRRDAKFKELGLSDQDVDTVDKVADVLAQHFALLQRPIIIRDQKAIVGRPKDRVKPFLS